MRESAQNWHIGWIVAAVALVASIILIIDIAAHRRAKFIDGALGTATLAAAQAAGAAVRSSEPDTGRLH
jgi:hypothetical protein